MSTFQQLHYTTIALQSSILETEYLWLHFLQAANCTTPRTTRKRPKDIQSFVNISINTKSKALT